MHKLVNHLTKQHQIPIRTLTITEKKEMSLRLQQRYFPQLPTLTYPLYLQKSPGVGILHSSDTNDWEQVLSHLKQYTFILFFDPSEEEAFFEVQGTHQFPILMEEFSFLNLYFHDPDTDFLVCYSDTEQIFLWGTAKKWIL